MTDTPVTTEELVLRERLADAALALRSAMSHIPEPIDTTEHTLAAMELALRSLSDVETATRLLADLEDATIAGALLARSSQSSCALIRAALAQLFAELDAAA